MAFTSIEIIALILIIAAVIKMIVLLVNPKSWMTFAKSVYSKPGLVKIVALILAILVFYYLTNAGITIVQILAVSAFMGLLIVMALAGSIGDLIKKYERQIKSGKLWKENWLYSLIWIVLLVLGLKELFM